MNLIPRRNDNFLLNPFQELERIQKEMNHLFDDTFGSAQGRSGSALDTVWAPLVDVTESDDKFTVTADLPGLDKKDIQVTLRDGILTIKGEKKGHKEDKSKGQVRSERFYGQFYRELALPVPVDESKIRAEYKNGVLELELTKKEEAKPKQIQININ